MCGRYAATLPPEVFRRLFGYDEQPNFPPRWNIAPTQPVAIVTADHGRRRFRLVRWGFLPAWVEDPKTFPLLFNARGESLADKATFRAALRHRRCIFLADAFYEWRRQGRTKVPYLVRRKDRGPLPLAGLWETYGDPNGSEIDTAAIVTTDANGLLSAVHERMPVILGEDGIDSWLDTDRVDAKAALSLVRPCPSDRLELVPVGERINRVAHDDPDVQTPLGPPAPAPVERRPADEGAQGVLF